MDEIDEASDIVFNGFITFAGGIAGSTNATTINNCYSLKDIVVSDSIETYIGGIVGQMDGGKPLTLKAWELLKQTKQDLAQKK